MRHSDESDLISRCGRGDEGAWKELISRYGEPLFRYCYGGLTRDEDAAYDLAQETWGKCARNLHTFRSESKFTTWLFRIATNTWLNRVRTRERKPEEILELDPVTQQLPEPVCNVSPDLQVRASHDLDFVLKKLSPECQSVINLRYVLGYSEKEAAEFLDENEKSVSARLSRCRARARAIYDAG